MSKKKPLEKVVADAIQTLLLSDHMGDAHEATLELAQALGGAKLRDKCSDYMGGDTKALEGHKRFDILGEVEEDDEDAPEAE
jgi:hypothetical protein